jgi:hypothetical protein
VRRFMVLPVALATLLLAAAAGAVSGPSSTLRVSSLRVLYGHRVSITGRVTTDRAGQQVGILAQPYGRSSMALAATVTTRDGGYWSYRPRPSIQTVYQAQIGSKRSRAVTVGVQPTVTVHESGNGELAVHVQGGRSFTGRMVELQRLVSASAWKTVIAERLASRSAAVFATSLPSATIRIAVSVNQVGAGYLGTFSHALRYHAYALSLVPSGYKIRFGNRVKLSGRLSNAAAGRTIKIYQQQFKRSSPRALATVLTRADGTWSYSIKPVVQVTFFARWGRIESRRVRVGVMPLVTTHETANGHINTHVAAAAGFQGRLVKLQQLSTSGVWLTVAQKPLDYKSEAVFTATLRVATTRIAISVNEAGAGYLGSTSTPFGYHTA